MQGKVRKIPDLWICVKHGEQRTDTPCRKGQAGAQQEEEEEEDDIIQIFVWLWGPSRCEHFASISWGMM